MNLYELSHSWYEEYTPFLFVLPDPITQEEWKSLCNSYLPKAIDVLLTTETFYDDGSPMSNTIGWREITNKVVELLKIDGYKLVEPIKQDYFGGGSIGGMIFRATEDPSKFRFEKEDEILDESTLNRIAEYNNEMVERRNTWLIEDTNEVEEQKVDNDDSGTT